jgi:hypothetical protein
MQTRMPTPANSLLSINVSLGKNGVNQSGGSTLSMETAENFMAYRLQGVYNRVFRSGLGPGSPSVLRDLVQRTLAHCASYDDPSMITQA